MNSFFYQQNENMTKLDQNISDVKKIWGKRGIISKASTITVNFPENYFLKAPIVCLSVEATTEAICIVMDSITTKKVEIKSTYNADVYYHIIAIEI